MTSASDKTPPQTSDRGDRSLLRRLWPFGEGGRDSRGLALPAVPAIQTAHALRGDEAAEALAAALARAQAQGTGEEFVTFLQRFYAHAAPDDVARHSADQLMGLARTVFTLTENRRPGQPQIAIIDPEGRDGWTSGDSYLIAVNDDKPFLVDSLLATAAECGLVIRAVFHPVMRVKRDGRGKRTAIAAEGPGDGRPESYIVVAFDRVTDPEERATIVHAVERTFEDVAAAVSDWPRMLGKVHEAIAEIEAHPGNAPAEQVGEAVAFLRWMVADHFTFLGVRDYVFTGTPETGELTPEPATGLGTLRDPERRVLRRGANRAALTPEVRSFLAQPAPLIIAKSATRSFVHRRVHMDYVGVKRFDAQGRLVGERRFVGLFTSAAYMRPVMETPVLRRKARAVLERAGFPEKGHAAKALMHVLETFPRDDMFQIGEDELFEIARGILYLGERPRTRVFLRYDRFDRYAVALVYVPRDKYSAQVRLRVAAVLADMLGGHVTESTPSFGDGLLARILYIVVLPGDQPHPRPALADLQERVVVAARAWTDTLEEALRQAFPELEAERLLKRYAQGFGPGYQEHAQAAEALADIAKLEGLLASRELSLAVHSFRRAEDAPHTLRFRMYNEGKPVSISDCLPLFETMGLKVLVERSHTVQVDGDIAVALQDFEIADAQGREIALDTPSRARLEAAFLASWSGIAETDGFNRLVLAAGLTWNEVVILRALAKFLRQAGTAFSQEYLERALAQNAVIARLLVRLFTARFDPAAAPAMEARHAAMEAVREEIKAALRSVASADEDRILRRFRMVIDATVRTNAFQRGPDGQMPAVLALKIASARVDDLPAPRPLYEIFVYAPDVEGVHLRFGMVARGGIRWSDRREDFRTEVLGLVKTQQVKNAVIVPVGAKGGFLPKRLPAGPREAIQAEGERAYRLFIGALLDVTDNIVKGALVPPAGVVRHDDDDPYLVVAADKGTATFSDIANGIAESRGFWLGDAFASGGSAGYDHKKMGITARGAWETVKRHFAEMGHDIQSQAFTVVGVGDMSGDVFGNGMLLSRFTKLIAAFDHRHIFIDPNPQPEISWRERKRLFDLPRSSWDDYDKSLISDGGGVWPRAARAIPLTPQLRTLTGLQGQEASPDEVIRALLTAPVDLLWFGGIGTFVKASTQRHADVGDRTNDALRVDAAALKAKVVGEGANLGFTQAARIEFARAGGRINTDAVDNSAGVDTSDHEVNIKILLSQPAARGELARPERDALLARMTDDVAAHVLAHNNAQALCLSIAEREGYLDLDGSARFIRELERRGRLDRAVEGLPDDDAIRQLATQRRGLTRPETAVLMAYAKLTLFDAIVASPLPDDPYFAPMLAGYFPDEAVRLYPGDVGRHRLRREIIATVLANDLVNMGGPILAHRLQESTGAPEWVIARAFIIARDAFRLDALWQQIAGLDPFTLAAAQLSMHADLIRMLRRAALWFLVNIPLEATIGETVATYRAGVDQLRGTFAGLVTKVEARSIDRRIAELQGQGVPHAVADEVGALLAHGAMPEVVHLAARLGVPVDRAAGAYFAMGARTGLDRLRADAAAITAGEHFDRLAISRIVDELFVKQRTLTAQALAASKGGTREDGVHDVEAWATAHADALARLGAFLAELERSGDLTIGKLTLANTQVRELLAA